MKVFLLFTLCLSLPLLGIVEKVKDRRGDKKQVNSPKPQTTPKVQVSNKVEVVQNQKEKVNTNQPLPQSSSETSIQPPLVQPESQPPVQPETSQSQPETSQSQPETTPETVTQPPVSTEPIPPPQVIITSPEVSTNPEGSVSSTSEGATSSKSNSIPILVILGISIPIGLIILFIYSRYNRKSMIPKIQEESIIRSGKEADKVIEYFREQDTLNALNANQNTTSYSQYPTSYGQSVNPTSYGQSPTSYSQSLNQNTTTYGQSLNPQNSLLSKDPAHTYHHSPLVQDLPNPETPPLSSGHDSLSILTPVYSVTGVDFATYN